MPPRIELGKHAQSSIMHAMGRAEDFKNGDEFLINHFNYRVVMGFFLPKWQRGLVWKESQEISFLESAWRGLSLGTYTYNTASIGSPYENLLIDGQQRMRAFERYFNNEFKVFGYCWDELGIEEQRGFKTRTVFASFNTETENEEFLKEYYNLTNFGGTAHKDNERV